MTVHSARILQIAAAPGRLADDDGNTYCGFALVELDLEESDGTRQTVRDILPFNSTGGIILPDRFEDIDGLYYGLHGLGDRRPPYAEFFGENAERIQPEERHRWRAAA